jgi:ABC-2 type transport system ATP-binding protein
MIEVRKVSKRYGSIEAVKDVSFSIGKGEVVGLLGPNGAGKTTLMKILTGYHFPSSGNVTILGYDVYTESLKIKSEIGYLPENAPVYPDLNVYEYLDFIADARGLTAADKQRRLPAAIEETGLNSVVFRPIAKLSKGFQQRVGLAQAVIHSPELLILDEPTTGLDPHQIMEIRKLIQTIGREKTVILSTHILQEVEAVCSRVLIMNRGEIIAQGSTEAIRSSIQGDAVFVAEVRGATPQKLKASVEKESRFRQLISMDTAGDTARLEIGIPPETADGATIFEWAVRNNYTLTELHRKTLSLEDVFLNLTGKEEVSNA